MDPRRSAAVRATCCAIKVLADAPQRNGPPGDCSIRGFADGVEAFLKFIDVHPEHLYLPAGLVLYKALMEAFPCK
jgi:hypothetical protein